MFFFVYFFFFFFSPVFGASSLFEMEVEGLADHLCRMTRLSGRYFPIHTEKYRVEIMRGPAVPQPRHHHHHHPAEGSDVSVVVRSRFELIKDSAAGVVATALVPPHFSNEKLVEDVFSIGRDDSDGFLHAELTATNAFGGSLLGRVLNRREVGKRFAVVTGTMPSAGLPWVCFIQARATVEVMIFTSVDRVAAADRAYILAQLREVLVAYSRMTPVFEEVLSKWIIWDDDHDPAPSIPPQPPPPQEESPT